MKMSVEVVGSTRAVEEFDSGEAAYGHALATLSRHMHAPGTVVLVHRGSYPPMRLTLHKDRSHVTVTL